MENLKYKKIKKNKENFELAKEGGYKWVMVFKSPKADAWVMTEYKFRKEILEKVGGFENEEYYPLSEEYSCFPLDLEELKMWNFFNE